MIRNWRLCQASWISFYGFVKGFEKDKTYWNLDRNKGFMVSAYYCILVPVCFSSMFSSNWSWKCVWFSTKRNFLRKVAFWAKVENAQNLMELWRSINQKVQCAFQKYPLLIPSITKLPLIKSPQFSRLSELIPLISSLYSPFALKLTLTPLISSIIKIQTQKHNLKINQTTTIKEKKFLLS